MNRRLFLAGAGSLAAAASLPSFAQAKNPKKGLSILQGFTTGTTTQLTVDVDRDARVAYSLTDTRTGKVIEPSSLKPVTFGNSGTRVDKLKFSGLLIGHRYHLIVKDVRTNVVLDDRFLSTVDLNKKGAKVALMSCMNDNASAMKNIWASAEAADCDYLLFIGDAVYGDFWIMHGPSYLWGRYIESRSKIPYYHWKELKPVIAVWDDHDFGKNDADGNYKYKNHAYQIFQTFFAQEPDGKALVNGWGNSCFFQAFNQNFVLFDGRYYRSLPNPDGDAGFFGHQQIDWVTTKVQKNPRPTWVLQGSPMFGRTEKNASYECNAPEELEYFIKKVRSWNSPVIFGGGDLHFSEISRIDKSLLGYETFELISSCMHSNTKSKFYDNPNRQIEGYLEENFLVLEHVGGKDDPSWNVSCIGKNSERQFETFLKVG